VGSSHPDGLEWRRSKWCDGGTCIEVAELDTGIMIRNSAQPDIFLEVGDDAWRDFVSRVRAGPSDEG
jgi:hypothetical protein